LQGDCHLFLRRYNQSMNARREQIEALCRENRLRLMYVFGSRAGEVWALLNGDGKSLPQSASDVDIAVLPAAALTVDQKVTLALALEKLFDVERVDLVSLAQADPFLAVNAIRGKRLYAFDAYEADEYDLYVLRRAGDLAEVERARMALALRDEAPQYVASGKLSKRVFADRLAWVEKMLAEIRKLPLESQAAFFGDSRNPLAAESCLRRALEALFDLGRHILSKGFGVGATEYKEIASGLNAQGVLSADEAELMRKLAGYRNRLVHFYHDVEADELYEVCAFQLGDVERIANALREWAKSHEERMDDTL
ncbi:MAG: HepT-like ribonuclease domain-containing protein, partial [Anaerolineales bacterium]